MSKITRKRALELKALMQRFKAALALKGMTIEQWCELNELSYSHTYQVMTGRRESTPLVERVERFANETLGAAQLEAVSA